MGTRCTTDVTARLSEVSSRVPEVRRSARGQLAPTRGPLAPTRGPLAPPHGPLAPTHGPLLLPAISLLLSTVRLFLPVVRSFLPRSPRSYQRSPCSYSRSPHSYQWSPRSYQWSPYSYSWVRSLISMVRPLLPVVSSLLLWSFAHFNRPLAPTHGQSPHINGPLTRTSRLLAPFRRPLAPTSRPLAPTRCPLAPFSRPLAPSQRSPRSWPRSVRSWPRWTRRLHRRHVPMAAVRIFTAAVTSHRSMAASHRTADQTRRAGATSRHPVTTTFVSRAPCSRRPKGSGVHRQRSVSLNHYETPLDRRGVHARVVGVRGGWAQAVGSGEFRGTLVDATSRQPLDAGSITVSACARQRRGWRSSLDPRRIVSRRAPRHSDATSCECVCWDSLRSCARTSTSPPNTQSSTSAPSRSSAAAAQVTGQVVTAERADVTMSPDRTSFETKNMTAASGGTAVDVLRNVPSVEVDATNQVSLRGNQWGRRANQRTTVAARAVNSSAISSRSSRRARSSESMSPRTRPRRTIPRHGGHHQHRIERRCGHGLERRLDCGDRNDGASQRVCQRWPPGRAADDVPVVRRVPQSSGHRRRDAAHQPACRRAGAHDVAHRWHAGAALAKLRVPRRVSHHAA